MKHVSRPLIASAIASAIATALLAACGGGSNEPTTQAVEIAFTAVAGNDAVTCASTLSGLGNNATTAQLKDLRFYIANVRLVSASGAEVPLTLGADSDWNATVGANSLTLIDLEDKTGACGGTTATHTVIQGTVPAGSYTGIKMTLGVPQALNHTDQGAATTPAVINNAVHPGMAWSWAGGRKFAKIEATNTAWTAPTFNVHLGATGCTGDNPAAGLVTSCAKPNRLDFGFTAFNPATQKIAVDVKALLLGQDVTANAGGPTGCMSGPTDPECGEVFKALAIDWKADGSGSGLTLGDGSSQTLFKVVAR